MEITQDRDPYEVSKHFGEIRKFKSGCEIRVFARLKKTRIFYSIICIVRINKNVFEVVNIIKSGVGFFGIPSKVGRYAISWKESLIRNTYRSEIRA